ncbi:hypothetical protein ACJD0Z_02695 [Flavobacteriaceae bacterium M23B6Z8]
MIAQESFKIKNQRNLGGYDGILTANYIVKDNDTILNGKFKFENVFTKNGDFISNPIKITGAFKNGLPDGNWNFNFGFYSQNQNKDLVDFQYVIKLNGVKESVSLRLQEGVPNGPWLTQIDSLENSQITKTMFKSELEYVNGLPQRTFKIENSNEVMVGRLLRDAVAHDVWTFFSKTDLGYEENWSFDQGLLRVITTKTDNLTKQVDLNYGNSDSFENTNLNEHYLDIINLRLRQQDNAKVSVGGMGALLMQDSKIYEDVLDFFNDLGTPLKVEGFKVRVPLFPLTKKDKESIKEIAQNYQKADTLINTILDDAQLNILRLNDSVSAQIFEIANSYKSSYLKPISQIVAYDRNKVLEHIDIKKLINGLSLRDISKSNLSDKNEDYLKSILDVTFESKFIRDLQDVHKLSEYCVAVARALSQQLELKLSRINREKAFLKQESELVNKTRTVNKLLDSLQQSESDFLKGPFSGLKSLMKNELELYAGMNESADKLQFGENLIRCLKNIRSLAEVIVIIPVQVKEIKELYQDQVWNPFTATIMNEDVKRRLVRAYQHRLIPFYLHQIETKIQCDQLNQIKDDLQHLHKKMVELRDEDTKKLERKLKRNKKSEDILKLFGLSSRDE